MPVSCLDIFLFHFVQFHFITLHLSLFVPHVTFEKMKKGQVIRLIIIVRVRENFPRSDTNESGHLQTSRGVKKLGKK